MNGLVEIRAPNAVPKRCVLGRDPLVLGRSPRNGLAIPTADELADEHLILSPGRAGCHLALVPGAELRPRLHGRAFRQCDVAWGDEVVLGRTSLRFLGPRVSRGPSPIFVAGVLAVMAFVAWFAFKDPAPASFGASLPSPPALFSAPKSCVETGPDALVRADEVEQSAMARAERYKFDVQDGIAAASLYGLAANCYERGGDANSAARARQLRELWVTRLETKYQAHHLRLRLALDRHDRARAIAELEQLALLLKGRTGPYMQWLSWASAR